MTMGTMNSLTGGRLGSSEELENISIHPIKHSTVREISVVN